MGNSDSKSVRCTSFNGQVTERPKVAVLKTDVSKGTVGSNPTLPAKVLKFMGSCLSG